jgi:UDPglucose 6-dehydrogenase
MMHPDRIVLGELDDRSGSEIEELVREFYGDNVPPVLRVSPVTAEMIKYASNAFLATKIAFINEIANLCERYDDVDVREVADGMGFDHRIGRAFLDAGLGFGGSCLPKDLRALVEGARRKKVRLRVAEATLSSNELQPLRAVRMARGMIGRLRGKQAAVLGLAFKPGTSDMREAPSVKVVRELVDAGMSVSVYDPMAMDEARKLFGNTVRYAKDIRDCLKGTDCCLIVTEWDEFKAIQPGLFIDAMARPVVIDGRRVLEPAQLDPRIAYVPVGLGKPGRG